MEKSFGQKMREARLERKMTLKQLAEQMNSHETTLCRYENGRTMPSFKSASKICKCLNISI